MPDEQPTDPVIPPTELNPDTTSSPYQGTTLAAQENATSSVGPTSLPPKKKRGGVAKILAVLIVLGLLAGGGYWWWTKQHDKTPVALVATSEEKSATSSTTPFEQIDQQLAQYKVDGSAVDGNDTYMQVAFEFNDQHNFAIAKPSQQQAYKLAEAPGPVSSGTEDYCAPLDSQWQSKVSDAQKIFKDASYIVTASRYYSQYNDCGKLLIASNTTEACSLYYGLGGSAKALFISLACSPLSDLSEKIAQSKEVAQIYTDVGTPLQANSPLVPEVGYLKDSNTPGYRIAKISSVGDFYYYKKTDGGKWAAVNTDSGLSCSIPNTEARAAFRGQECYTGTATSTVN